MSMPLINFVAFSQACSDGTYGPKCLEQCSDTCATGRCNAKNGKCTEGCINGQVKGPYCLKSKYAY